MMIEGSSRLTRLFPLIFLLLIANLSPEKTTDVPVAGIDVKSVCETCHSPAEPWVCLTCYKAHCGRYVHEHALMHQLAEPSHSMALSLADLSVWCYPCEAYVHNEKLIPAKCSAHQSKFGEAMPH